MFPFTKKSFLFLGFFCVFGPLLMAQTEIPPQNPVVRSVSPAVRQPYPIAQPSYQVPNDPGVPNRPFRQLVYADNASPSSAWTQGVIKEADRRFDFKTVAKGTKSEHRFVLYNPCAENLHIAGVSASCTCTTPFILDNKAELQTYEKTAIVAHFRTEAYEGLKTATITVVIDKPQYAEIQLHVQGNIRSDVAMTPSDIRFGSVKEGQGAERTVEVAYTGGRADWRIVNFTSPNKNLSAEIVDVKPELGKTTTKVKVKLAADAPSGIINERFCIVSNDSDLWRELPLLVSATVGKVLTVTPQTQFLGYLKPGEASVQKETLIRGTEHFKITKIECDDPNVEIKFTPDPDASKIFYHIPVVFKNPPGGSPKLNKETGTLLAVVKVETDDPTQKLSFNVTANIVGEPTE